MIFEVSDSLLFVRVLPVAVAGSKAFSNTIQLSVEQIEAVVSTNLFTFSGFSV
jgi:hypothetical protein